MIELERPTIIDKGGEAIIFTNYKLNKENREIWLKVPSHYKKYLVTENLDGFVVGLLFLALETNHDLKLNAPISARLLYSLNHYLIPALCLAHPQFEPIKIFADEVNYGNLNEANVAGTGLSCGVDSFATYFDHINEKGPFKIEYFAFFNVGSHGSGEGARKLFYQRLKKPQHFAQSIDKELVTVDSNLSENLMMKFQQTSTLRNASCVLILQKLFRNYYVASKNRFDYFKLHGYSTQDYDTLILDLLSTESTSFFSAVSSLTRVERTFLLSQFAETYNHLDVCTSVKNMKEEGVNCSRCSKCLRTALTLDLLGQLEKFNQVFDIDTYRKYKYSYIGHIASKKDHDQINADIYKLLKKKGEIDFMKITLSRINNKTAALKKVFS